MSRYFLILLSLVFETFANQFPSFSNNVALEEGQRQYTSLSRESEMPKHGSCWKDALRHLHIGCKLLNDETQTHLALKFTNCFMSKSGLKMPECDPDKDVISCVKFLDGRGFLAYANFFTHTHSMCAFLQNQIWNAEIAKSIMKLNENSMLVSDQLEESKNIQFELIESQRKSIETQKTNLIKNDQISLVLQTSKENVNQIISEVKTSTEQQTEIIMSIFDRVAFLQSIMSGEVTGFSIIFYLLVQTITVYIFTLPSRTKDARCWLYFFLLCNFIFERVISEATGCEFDFVAPGDVETAVSSRQWFCRYFFSATAVGVVYSVVTNYQDLASINNQMLNDIVQENMEMRRLNSELRSYIHQSRVINESDNNTPTQRHSYNLRRRISVHRNPITEVESPQQFYNYVANRNKQASITSD